MDAPPPRDPDDPIDYLFSLERLGMKFGLDTIRSLCAALGEPQTAFSSVIIAGTNGKGSVTAMVERGLRAAKRRTGRYTSPHLLRLNERFAVNGREASTAELRRAAEQVRSAAGRTRPTFFEFATAMAFVLFRERGVDLAVLEVGLGGRLDATNVATPVAAAITSIDFDHQAQLGNTLGAIAREKAGIIKGAIPVVCGALPEEAEQVVRDVCRQHGATFIAAPPDLEPPWTDVPLALRGRHQRGNASVAVSLLTELNRLGIPVGTADIRTALTDVHWPARLEELAGPRGARVMLDAAHNPAGARALVRALEELGWLEAALVVGAVRDKDVAGIVTPLTAITGPILCTAPDTPRALPAAELGMLLQRLAGARHVEVVSNPADALVRACALRSRVVVTGSIFLVGPVRGILRAS